LGNGDELARVGAFLTHLAGLGNDLGNELAAAGWLDAQGHFVGPVAIAPVADPTGFRARLQSELPQLERDLAGDKAPADGQSHLKLVSDPLHAAAGHGLLVWVSDADGAVVVACSPAALAGMATAL